jgi:cytochrome b6-f complex iron-sulfur subunit
VGWAAFAGAMATLGGAFQRFLFPNVLREPPQQFKAGFPEDFIEGLVDERFKSSNSVWIVKGHDKITGKNGIYVLSTICTHLGCTPNWLEGEAKFKCPCHGSGFYKSGMNFEGPAPRPLERFKVVLADDGQVSVDKSRKFQFEKGQWNDPEAFLKA